MPKFYGHTGTEYVARTKVFLPAVRYSLKMENAARGALEYDLSVRVQKVGVVILYPQPWLCCSPDGVFTKDGETVLVEIKCPFSRKEQVIVDFEQKQSFVSHIIFEESASIKLKKGHAYYSQVQLSLYCTGLNRCCFFVYSSKQRVALDITINNEFLAELLPRLERFYFMHYLPALQQHSD